MEHSAPHVRGRMFPAPRRPGYKVPSVLSVPNKPTRAQVEHERFQAQLLAAGRAEYDELAILRSTLASPRDGLRIGPTWA